MPSLGGIVTMSSFLPPCSAVFKSLQENSAAIRTPLLMCHGTEDDVVPYDWGKQTADTFKKLGMDCQFTVLPGIDHSVCPEELQLLRDWVEKRLEDNSP